MRDAGLHGLAYCLTLDPAEEIRCALEQAANSGWRELGSLDKVLTEVSDGTIEAKVDDAPVRVSENTASYRSEAVELPENYQDSPYEQESGAEVSYNAPNVDWNDAEVIYDKELDQQAFCAAFKIPHGRPVYHSAEVAERVEARKIEAGFSMSFLLYALKSSAI